MFSSVEIVSTAVDLEITVTDGTGLEVGVTAAALPEGVGDGLLDTDGVTVALAEGVTLGLDEGVGDGVILELGVTLGVGDTLGVGETDGLGLAVKKSLNTPV